MKIRKKYAMKGSKKGMKNEDIRLMIGDVKFSARAVSVIEYDGKILFQKGRNDKNWALPGGAIATLEAGREVVLRELEEETGEKNAKVIRPIWFAEYFFEFHEKINHQYILGYLVSIPENSILTKQEEFEGIETEKHIIYKWIPNEDIKKMPIKPDYLKEKLTNINETYEFIEENHLK